jgi:hypothetical protein
MTAATHKLINAWNYLAENGEQFANKESGLKEEFQPILFAGYCVALQHLAYALNLPVELEDFDEESADAKRIRKAFPVPPIDTANESHIRAVWPEMWVQHVAGLMAPDFWSVDVSLGVGETREAALADASLHPSVMGRSDG